MNDHRSRPAGRNIGLDIIRFVAVLLVLGSHLRMPPDPSFFLSAWNRGGWVGVELFFVLSGFLVSSILFREHQRSGAIDFRRFLIRRGLKIYPSFWLMLGTTLGLYWYFQHPVVPLRLLGDILFLQNYLGSVWPHTWSLAVEEHFYLGLVGLFWLLIRRSTEKPFHAIPYAFLMVTLVCHLLRIFDGWGEPSASSPLRIFWTQHRLDSLLFGVLIAYQVNYQNVEVRFERVPSWLLISAGGLCLSIAILLSTNVWIHVFGSSLCYFGSGLVLFGSMRLKSTSSKLLKFIAALGTASYSIYLWHMPVNLWGYTILEKVIVNPSFSTYLVMYVVTSFAFGFVMNQLFENRFLRWRNYWFPSSDSANSLPQSTTLNSTAVRADL